MIMELREEPANWKTYLCGEWRVHVWPDGHAIASRWYSPRDGDLALARRIAPVAMALEELKEFVFRHDAFLSIEFKMSSLDSATKIIMLIEQAAGGPNGDTL